MIIIFVRGVNVSNRIYILKFNIILIFILSGRIIKMYMNIEYLYCVIVIVRAHVALESECRVVLVTYQQFIQY